MCLQKSDDILKDDIKSEITKGMIKIIQKMLPYKKDKRERSVRKSNKENTTSFKKNDFLSNIDKSTSETKIEMTKNLVNIIKKLKDCCGLERKRFLSKVCKDFKMDKEEKFVITKLRMMLIRLDAGVEHLQIKGHDEKDELMKNHKTKAIIGNKEDPSNLGDKNLQKVKEECKLLYKRQAKTKPRKNLESKQLEKLRNNLFTTEKGNSIPINKEDFLRNFSLHPQIFCY